MRSPLSWHCATLCALRLRCREEAAMGCWRCCTEPSRTCLQADRGAVSVCSPRCSSWAQLRGLKLGPWKRSPGCCQ